MPTEVDDLVRRASERGAPRGAGAVWDAAVAHARASREGDAMAGGDGNSVDDARAPLLVVECDIGRRARLVGDGWNRWADHDRRCYDGDRRVERRPSDADGDLG